MKTTFNGVINGKTFTNVQEYNKEMIKLLSNNQKIEAQASTKTIDDCPICKEQEGKCGCKEDENCICEGCGYDNDTYEYDCNETACVCKKDEDQEPKKEYIDYTPFVSSSDEDYHITLEDILDKPEFDMEKEEIYIKDYLQRCSEQLKKAIQKHDDETLINYGEEVDVILNRFDIKRKFQKETEKLLNVKYNNTEKEINQLKNKLQNISDRRKIISDGLKLFNLVNDFYNNIYDEVVDEYNKRQHNTDIKDDSSINPKTNIIEKESQKEFDLNKEDTFLNLLDKMIQYLK